MKLVVLGGGPSQRPFIAASRRLGYDTHVIDPYLPTRFDEVHYRSIRDPQGVLEACEAIDPDGVIGYSSHPMALRSWALVCDLMNLPGPDVRLMQMVENKGLCLPGIRTPAAGGEMVKPKSGTCGGIGVVTAPKAEQILRSWFIAASMSMDYTALCQKRIVGREMTVGGHIRDGVADVLICADKVPKTPTSEAEYTLHEDQDAIDTAIKVVEILGIDNSFWTVDIIVDDDGPCVLEAGLMLDSGVDRLLYDAGVDVYTMACECAVGA